MYCVALSAVLNFDYLGEVKPDHFNTKVHGFRGLAIDHIYNRTRMKNVNNISTKI